jgi:hypothetical protein
LRNREKVADLRRKRLSNSAVLFQASMLQGDIDPYQYGNDGVGASAIEGGGGFVSADDQSRVILAKISSGGICFVCG